MLGRLGLWVWTNHSSMPCGGVEGYPRDFMPVIQTVEYSSSKHPHSFPVQIPRAS